MLGAIGYKTKKNLKENIGKSLSYTETSLYGAEYKPDGVLTMVGPCAYTKRVWFAQITMKAGLIQKVA